MSAFFSIGRSSGKQKENRNETVRWMRNEWYMVWWLIYIYTIHKTPVSTRAKATVRWIQTHAMMEEGRETLSKTV